MDEDSDTQSIVGGEVDEPLNDSSWRLLPSSNSTVQDQNTHANVSTSVNSTPDPLNVGFMDESNMNELENSTSSSVHQSSTISQIASNNQNSTGSASNSAAVVEKKNEIVSLHPSMPISISSQSTLSGTSTINSMESMIKIVPMMISIDTMPQQIYTTKSVATMTDMPKMVSIGTMSENPTTKSTETMTATPMILSTGTMPRTSTLLSSSANQAIDLCSTTPNTIDLVSPIPETIDLCTPSPAITIHNSPDSTLSLAPP